MSSAACQVSGLCALTELNINIRLVSFRYLVGVNHCSEWYCLVDEVCTHRLLPELARISQYINLISVVPPADEDLRLLIEVLSWLLLYLD
jgi:hypothetical protein